MTPTLDALVVLEQLSTSKNKTIRERERGREREDSHYEKKMGKKYSRLLEEYRSIKSAGKIKSLVLESKKHIRHLRLKYVYIYIQKHNF